MALDDIEISAVSITEKEVTETAVDENLTEYKSTEDKISEKLEKSLLDELKQEREVVDESKSEIPDDHFENENENQNIFEKEKEEKRSEISVSLKNKLARGEATILTRTNDAIHSFVCSLISNDDVGKFQASKSDLKEIEDIIYEFRRESDKHLPAWLQIALFIGATYGPIYKSAFDVRKLNKRNAELEAEIKIHREQSAAQNTEVLNMLRQIMLDKQNEKNEKQEIVENADNVEKSE